MNWDELFIRMAMLIALKSKDPSTKVGCVIVSQDNVVLSMGFNGFPRGVKETLTKVRPLINGGVEVIIDLNERWERPAKYSWVEHAERNAVYNAARVGIKLAGARAYLNFEPTCLCADCARAFIQAGIVEVIGPNIPFKGTGSGINYHLEYAQMMFAEAGVNLRVVDLVI
jgi:dCMP deaminase